MSRSQVAIIYAGGCAGEPMAVRSSYHLIDKNSTPSSLVIARFLNARASSTDGGGRCVWAVLRRSAFWQQVTFWHVRCWTCSFPLTIEWILPLPCYVKALIPQSLEHMLPYQNPVMSLRLPCGTAHTDDPFMSPTRAWVIGGEYQTYRHQGWLNASDCGRLRPSGC